MAPPFLRGFPSMLPAPPARSLCCVQGETNSHTRLSCSRSVKTETLAPDWPTARGSESDDDVMLVLMSPVTVSSNAVNDPRHRAAQTGSNQDRNRRPQTRTSEYVEKQTLTEKLYNSQGPELRRSLFSLKQLFQDDKDLVPEFVASEGLTCFVKVGAEADHNYQNYILRALSQIMLFVDGMNGVINHSETVQWLYTLTGSLSRLVVKTSLKLLIVFVEYAESNSPLLINAVNAVDGQRGVNPWSYLMEVLEERNGSDTELLMFAMTLINKTLAVLPDQDSFYDVTDSLEQLGMETIIHKHMNNKGTEPDLRAQFTSYEVSNT
ncbi:FH1/FH2 domain-containing protein 3 [Collichthys lucidus]|uniref:FH1/FH2 domain-containing protein 3 n=1 Tax=Collichthys lucidus TaxID=240159 RepID=A0A4U5TVZ8_COLLU|nr:FH1/FH2 domain-containing protein 3 [Collichthys lucidus]